MKDVQFQDDKYYDVMWTFLFFDFCIFFLKETPKQKKKLGQFRDQKKRKKKASSITRRMLVLQQDG